MYRPKFLTRLTVLVCLFLIAGFLVPGGVIKRAFTGYSRETYSFPLTTNPLGMFGTVTPTVTVSAPGTVPLGQQFSFTVNFQNTTGVTGYGPYVNVFLPTGGADGTSAGGPDDGYSYVSATYLGGSMKTSVLTCPSGGSVVSPLSGQPVTCPTTLNGRPTQLVVLQMPFGSFTPAQPPAPIVVTANMSNFADVGVSLPIIASGGFLYGDSPTGNMPSESPRSTGLTAPSLFSLSKSYNGPENETATGPNYPRSFTITPSMPAGQTATNVMVTDTLPGNIVYLGLSGSGYTVNLQPPLNTVITAPNNQLKVTFASIGSGSVTVNYYVPLKDSNGLNIVDPLSGAAGTTTNQASASGSWQPLDPRDSLTTVTATSGTVAVADRSIAIQKGVSNNAPPTSPGDVLTYSLNFQISDYFTFKNIVITDTLSDGQDYNAGSASVNVTDRSGNVVGTIPAGAITVQNDTPLAGQTTLTFDVSAALVALGAPDGILQGGRAIAPDSVAAQGVITFSTTIRDTYKAPPNSPLLMADGLSNSVSISGDVVPNNNPTGTKTGTATDGSSAGVSIPTPTLQKTLYALNGDTNVASPPRIIAGDRLTFRLKFTMPTGDYRSVKLTDTLPLPLFKAESLTNLTFNNISSGIPATGNAQYGPANSGSPLVTLPTISISNSAANNQITFSFPDNNDTSNTPTTIDVLFTLTATSDPYVDNLLFTNQADSYARNTAGNDLLSTVITDMVTSGPRLLIRKGIVGTDNPTGLATLTQPVPAGVTVNGANPCGTRLTGTVTSSNLGTTFNSNLSNVDAGDTVTYAIAVENIGTGRDGAFDVMLSDSIPAGSTLVPGSVCVNSGTGAAIPFTGSLPGTLTLTDPSSSQGALTQGVSYSTGNPVANATGSNIAIVTYQVTLDATVAPKQNILNTATITNYSAEEGGTNFSLVVPPSELTDTASVTIASPASAKTLVGTGIVDAGNSNTQAVIGELVTYRVVATIPEGVTGNVVITDTLDSGLAFVDVTNVTVSAGLALTNSISTGPTPSNTVITSSGQVITFSPGAITNSNTNNSVAETLTIEYRAVVLNTSSNQGDQTRSNSAVVTFTGGSLAAARANTISIVEPQVNTAKTVSINGGSSTTTQNADAGDTVVYTITLTQNANTPTAYDATLNDTIPAYIAGPTITSVVDSASIVTASNFSMVGNTLQTVAPIDLPGFSTPSTRTITIKVTGTLTLSVMPGNSIPNTANAAWSSLDGMPGALSTYNTNSTERDASGGVNDYKSAGTATITIYPTNPVKSIVATSESHTTGSNLAIGEIARYRLKVRIPEGTPVNLVLKDNLPAGLQYINDGAAKFAFVANTPGISSDTLTAAATGCNPLDTSPALQYTGDMSNVDSITPTCQMPDTAVSDNATTNSDTYGDGTDPFFKFGTLVNADSDANDEYVVVEFNALALNTIGNQSGTTLINNFSVISGGVTVATSSNLTATVVEPILGMTKTPSPLTGDAGDVITYTVVYTNSGANAATAFDTRLLDTLPSFLALNTASVAITPSGGASAGVSSSTGNTVDVSVPTIPVGGSVTVIYQATLTANVPAGLILTNTANLKFSSLPGANGTQSNPTGSNNSGTAGSSTGERDGSGGINDYSINATGQVGILTPGIVKLAPSPTSYAIGSDVTYNILVTLPEGETRNLVVKDDLPAGMNYVSYTLISTSAASGGLLANSYNGSALSPVLTPASPVDGDILNFTFGNVTTANDNNATTNQFIIRVVARVNNVSGNVNGTPLTNAASLTYTNPNNSATVTVGPSTQTITVIEPRLKIVKTPSTTIPRCGDTITYTLAISHTAASTSTAYEVALADAIPAGLSYVPASLKLVSGTPAPGTLTESGGSISATFATFPLGSTVTLEYKAQVNCPPATINQAITNTANLNWTSQSGSNANERTGAGGINSYFDSSPSTVTVTQPSIITAKVNNPTNGAPLSPGAIVTYTITVQNTGNAPATGVTFTDAIPANTVYVPSSTRLNGGAVADVAGVMPFAAGGQINTPGEPAGTINNGETATIEFKVTISNPLSLGVTQVSNQGLVKGSNIPDSPTNIVVNPVTGQPALDLVKSLNNLTRGNLVPAQPGDLLEYLIIVTNTGNLPATNVTLNDSIPAGTTYAGGSTTLNNLAVSDIGPAMPYVPPGGLISSPLAPAGQLNVGAGQAAYIRFRVTVNNPLALGTTQITNTATATGNGPNGALPPASNTVNTPVTGTPVLTPAKSVVNLTRSSGTAQPGDLLEYTITVTNNGNIASTGTTLTDTIPANTTYVAASTKLNGSPATDLPGPIQINSPGAPAGELRVGSINQATVVFRVTINSPLPLGVTQVTNQATVSGNSPQGPVGPVPSNPVTTPVTANPVLGAVKAVTNLTRSTGTAQPGDVLEYTITVNNTGNIASTATTLTDAIPANTTYVAASTKLNGLAASDMPGPIQINSPGAPAGELRVGTANAAVVVFRVTINNPFPPNVLEVINQASVSGTGPQGPVGPTSSNPVTTPVGANPILNPVKSVVNLSRSSGTAQPGDLLEYTIVVTNTGNTASTSTTFADAIPANTTYVAGSTTLNGAAASDMPGPISINSPGAPSGELRVGTPNAATIRFKVTINNPVPVGVTEVRNHGTVAGNGQGGIPLTPVPTNEVITPLATNPQLVVNKSAVNLTRSSGTAQPGDTLEYTVTVTNTGNTPAVNSTLTDGIPANTTYALSTTTLNGISVTDNAANMPFATGGTIQSPGAPAGQINVGAGQAAIVKFKVTINSPLPPGVTQVTNLATANGEGPTGNPVGPVPSPPVITPVGANPVLNPVKSVENLTRSSGTAQPGDILEYTVKIENTGNISATSAMLTDAIPANTAYVTGTTKLNGTPVADIAGAMPYATPHEIHSPTAPAGQLNAGMAEAAVVIFRVQIDNPLPLGVTTITNQATANGNGPTGNPVGPVPSNPVVTPLMANPMLEPTKSVANLSRASGTAQPGDILEYTITVTNTGNTPSTSTFVSDPIPANTTYVPASTTLNGSTAASINPGPLFINSPGAPAGQLNVGVSNRAVITFRVTIDSPLPPNVTTVTNLATINGDGPGGTPVGPVSPPPVVTPIGANPQLAVTKAVANLTRSSGTAQPGDILEYTVRVENTGNIAATSASLSDPIPGNTTYVAGSTTLNGNTAPDMPGPIAINSPGSPSGQLNVGAGQAAIVRFRVTIDNPLPPNVTQVANTATATANGQNDTPVGPVPSNEVITPVGAAPVLALTKTAMNLTRSSGTAKPGDLIKYTITIVNNGNIAATNATLTDSIPANTTYVGGSTMLNGNPATDITSSPIAVNSPGAPSGQLNVGAINAAVVMFNVTINNPLPANTTQVANTATANANGPGGPVPPASDMVTTPVVGNPLLGPVKSVVNLTRSSGTAQPGDTLEYTITVTNNGDIASTGTTLSDSIPLYTTYVAGSTTLNGLAAPNMPGPIAINSVGAPSGELRVGSANAAVIRFRVTINNPFPVNVLEVVNQAVVRGNSPSGSVGPVESNPVATPVGASPILNPLKSVVNLSRSSGTAQPGDILEYTVRVENSGNTISTSTTLTDPIPANTTYIGGSTKLNGLAAPNMPGPISINSPSAPAGELQVGAGNAAVVTFQVRVDNPLPPNVTEVRNLATVSGNGQGDTPLTPVPSNEVITPLNANPILSPTKSVVNLTRSSGTAQPGDTLEYTVTVENTGNISATGAILTDAIPANMTYLLGTTVVNGTPLADTAGPLMPFSMPHEIHSPGAPSGQLDVGTAHAVVVTFRVMINNPLPPNVTAVTNLATANANGPTGNPVGPQSPPPVITPVNANPVLVATKSVVNLTRTGTAEPGDILEYTVRVQNSGNIAATAAILSDQIPANTTYVAATTSLNGNPVADSSGNMPFSISGPINSPGAPSGQLNVGPAQAAVVMYRIRIDSVLPVGVTTVTNIATANANGPTSNPVGPIDSPPVVTPVATNPILSPTKSVVNLSRASGTAQPGDELEYTITVTNTGNTPATASTITDSIPANTVYVAASTTLNGNPASDITGGPLAINSPGAPSGQLDVGAPNRATVTFRVRILNPLPPNVTTVTNVATAQGNGPGGPVGPVSPPPVITPVGANPILSPAKTVANLSRATGSAKPGDILEYTIKVENTGNISATGATLSDPIPGNTTYVGGSTTLNGNSLTDNAGAMPYALAREIHSPSAPAGQLDVGAVKAAVITFRVKIDNPLPPDVLQVSNLATTNADGPTGQPVGPVSPPPVVTPVVASPIIAAVKSVTIVGGGQAAPESILEYTIIVTNSGDIVATGMTLSDAIPQFTTYVANSTLLNGAPTTDITSSPIAISSPGAPAGQLLVGQTNSATVKFRVTVVSPLPQGAQDVRNIGTVNGNGPAGPLPPAPTNEVITPLGTDLTITKTHTGTFTAGESGTFTITVKNLGPNDTIAPFPVTDTLPDGLTFFSGGGNGWICTALGQIVTCNKPGILLKNTSTSFTITVSISPSAPDTVINAATVAYVADTNTGNNTATDTVKINNGFGVPGDNFPGDSALSDQKPGSLLIYPVYTSDATNPNRENTRISLTNMDTNQPAYVHLFFVDGATCSVADNYICLTANQTVSFLASDIDPGVLGYIVAVAVDQNGCPTSFNRLAGDVYAKFSSGHFGSVSAESYSALYSESSPACDRNSVSAELKLDGVMYNQSARVLAAQLPSPADNNNTMIILARTGGNLMTGASQIGSIFGLVYNDIENGFSFTANLGSCLSKQTISSSFPRTSPRISQIIPAGHSGWTKFWTNSEAGIIGTLFNLNTSANGVSGAFNGAGSLHKLRLANDSFTIPVFPAPCK